MILFVLSFLFFLQSCSTPNNQHQAGREVASLPSQLVSEEREDLSSKAKECAGLLKDVTQADSQIVEAAFSTCLSNYIKIKTISIDGGDEHKAVFFFSVIFDELHIPYKIFVTPDLSSQIGYRYNLVATIPHNRERTYDWGQEKKTPGIILTHHADVVPTVAEQWWIPEDTYSGRIGSLEEAGLNADEKKGLTPSLIREKFIWGRGALDMKGMGITQLISMAILNASQRPLRHDIHFLMVADEEDQGSGAIGTLALMEEGKPLRALNAVSVLLNEGGGSIKGIPSENVVLNAIGTEEKGIAWMEMDDTNLSNLINNLITMDVLNASFKKAKRAKKHSYISKIASVLKESKCSIASIDIPRPKINIMASKLSVALDCKNLADSIATQSLQDVFAKIDSQKHFSFQAAVKPKRIELVFSTATSGHGSVSQSQTALTKTLEYLYVLGLVDIPKLPNKKTFYGRPIMTPATDKFINALKIHTKGIPGVALKTLKAMSFAHPIKAGLLKLVESELGVSGLFRNTCNFTNLIIKDKKAKAYIDCRLLVNKQIKFKDDYAAAFIDQIKDRIKIATSQLKVVAKINPSSTSFDTPIFRKITSALQSEKTVEAKNVVTPLLFIAGSDNGFFRNPHDLGFKTVNPIPSYGLFTLHYSIDLLSTMHGSNERFPVKEIKPTVMRYQKVVEALLD